LTERRLSVFKKQDSRVPDDKLPLARALQWEDGMLLCVHNLFLKIENHKRNGYWHEMRMGLVTSITTRHGVLTNPLPHAVIKAPLMAPAMMFENKRPLCSAGISTKSASGLSFSTMENSFPTSFQLDICGWTPK
jgi:hypothetical protein